MEAVQLARALGRLPGRLLVIGIEGKRFDSGAGLSPEVERAAERLADELAGQSLNTALGSS
jgi:hydrogenase maturation protease